MLSDVCLNMELPAFPLKQQKYQRTCLLQKNIESADCCLKPVLYLIKEENILQTGFQKVESRFCETPYNTKLVTQWNPGTHTLLFSAVRNKNLNQINDKLSISVSWFCIRWIIRKRRRAQGGFLFLQSTGWGFFSIENVTYSTPKQHGETCWLMM